MKYLYFGFYLILIIINVNYEKSDFLNIKNNKLIHRLYDYSYKGLIIPIQKLGYNYSLFKYLRQTISFSGLTGILFYTTVANLGLTIMVIILVAAIIPYLYYVNLKINYLNKIEAEVFNYATNIIIYLKEQQSVTDVLINTANNVENPLQKDLQFLLKYINDTNNFNAGLDMIENKYQYSFLKNVHILLKNAFSRGYNNFELYTYTFNSIEEYQLIINNYRIKKATNRKLFYFMIFLDLLGVNILLKMFATNLFSDSNIANIIFVYYLLNIITVFYYETFCLKINTIEKGMTL